MDLSMIKQAQELRSRLEKAQKELAALTVEGDAGHGAVKVTANGQQKILSVTISPKLVDPAKVEKLQDTIQEAVNDALTKSQKKAASQLKGLTGGLKIPGLT